MQDHQEEKLDEGGTPLSTLPGETTAVCFPVLSFPSATDRKENSESDQNDNKMKIKGTANITLHKDQPSTELRTYTTKQDQTCISVPQDTSVMCAADSIMQAAKTCALIPNEIQSEEFPDVLKSKTQQESQQLTSPPPQINLKTDLRLKHGTENTNRSPHSTGDFTFSSEHLTPELEAFKINNAQEQEKHCGDITVAPKNVVTIILNMEPQDMQNSESVGPDVLRCSQEAGSFSADITEVSIMDCDEKKSGVSTLNNSESNKINLKNHNFEAQSDVFETAADSQEKEFEDANVRPTKVYTIVLELKPQVLQETENVGASSVRAELLNEKVTESYTGNPESYELMHNELLNSSKSCHTISECQPPGANAAETTFPDVKQDDVTDCCHHEEQTMSSVLCTVEDSVQTGNVLTETQISAGDNKQMMAVNSVQSTGTGHEKTAEELSDPECLEFKHSKVPERDDLLLKEERESKLPLVVDTAVSQRRVCVTAFSVFLTILYYKL